jgi:hypothetical protein
MCKIKQSRLSFPDGRKDLTPGSGVQSPIMLRKKHSASSPTGAFGVLRRELSTFGPYSDLLLSNIRIALRRLDGSCIRLYAPVMRQIRIFIAIGIMVWQAACAPAPGYPISRTAPTATQPGCQPSQTQPTKSGFPEVRVNMKSSGEMWALLFFDNAKAMVDEKIVWRINGSGQLDFRAQNEDGMIIHPIWGPDYHENSTWNRPGEEWGTGFNFPEPGCWTITVTQGTTIGEIRLRVLAP